MFIETVRSVKVAFLLVIFFTILTGLIYPLLITGLAQLLFPWQANGSLITENNKAVGSVLIGQSFDSSSYFWGRPSATTPYPYNSESSSGSNLGPSNPSFLSSIKDRVSIIQKSNPENHQAVPVDLVTASGSGLDPEISPLAALYQIPRIAKARHLSEADIQSLVQSQQKNRTLGLLGEPRINVLQLNLALDKLVISSKSKNTV